MRTAPEALLRLLKPGPSYGNNRLEVRSRLLLPPQSPVCFRPEAIGRLELWENGDGFTKRPPPLLRSPWPETAPFPE